MCGLFGIVTRLGLRPSLAERAAERAAARLAHRGPDGSGVLTLGPAVLAHRRLAIIDPTPAGAQPMRSVCGRHAIVYNGELYNDAEVRRELARTHGVCFRTSCDTETVLAALVAWGTDAGVRLRGMYALAWLDLDAGRLTLARDPLGIKPLYWARREHPREPGVREVLFASEPSALFEGTGLVPRPSWPVVSAYLTTLRPVVGEQTLFDGVSVLRPGAWRVFDLTRGELPERVVDHGTDLAPHGVPGAPHGAPGAPHGAPGAPHGAPGAPHGVPGAPHGVPGAPHGVPGAPHGASGAPGRAPGAIDVPTLVRRGVTESVERHLRSDVPVCAMLSGGLDSSIICTIAARRVGTLCTYAAGASDDDADVVAAREVARELGTVHTTVLLGEERFVASWRALVDRLGVPVCTPNETAIFAVAQAARGDGFKVALTGEGADELFAGYALPLDMALEHARGPDGADGGRFQLDSNQWVPIAHKHAVLSARAFEACHGDGALLDRYRSDFAALRALGAGTVGDARAELLATHLRFHRRVNLPNLLARLDTAAMLAGVEGRTPLADATLAALAESLPIGEKFEPVSASGVGVAAPASRRTKIALRRAFEADVPPRALTRAKESFPLPFERWLTPACAALRESPFARSAFTPAAVASVTARPEAAWHLLWPMANVALWADRWGWASA